MKDYEVTLMAVSYQTVTVTAPSERDAVKMAQKIYFSTDALNFTDEDVKKISADVCEADPSPEDENADDAAEEDSEICDDDEEEEPEKEDEENSGKTEMPDPLLRLVQTIRSSKLPDEKIAGMMQAILKDVWAE